MIKAPNSGIMRALKWKLIRVYSFVATKNSSNLDSSCDMLARTLTLEPENSTESQLCHSLRVRMDTPSNFRFLTGLSWESEDVCVCECTSHVSKHDANMRDDGLPSSPLEFSQSLQSKENQLRKLGAGTYCTCPPASVIEMLHDLNKGNVLIFPTLILSIHLNVRNNNAGFSRTVQ